jgi:hypothetical protein
VVRRALVLTAGFASTLAVASSAWGAAPNYIMVSGHDLARPVLLANWNENLELLLSVANAPRASKAVARGLSRRARLDLAEFWDWSYLPPPKKPGQANQHGTFYPAHGAQPAVILITVDGTKLPRLVPAKALRIFRRHGVPVRL